MEKKNIYEKTFNFLKINTIQIFLILDVFFVLVFLVVYIITLNLPVNLKSFFDIFTQQPILLILVLHPLFFGFYLFFNLNKYDSEIEDLVAKMDYSQRKIEKVNVFIDQLRSGQKTIDFSEEFKSDPLIRSLLNLKDELERTRKEEEIRKKQEQQRFWTNEGLAKFGAILRENVDNLENLAHEITKNITQYMGIQQAGFFVVTEQKGEKYIEALSLFAFNRKKFPDKKFLWGEGLIGAAALEKKTINLPETSEGYLEITSGLGKANPRSILIVPIIDNNDNVHGVLELASFKKFEEYEINFVEQVANSIGLTMATIKNTLQTQQLLRESQKQAELLAEQEEIMRKNIEEILQQANEYENELKRTQSKLSQLVNLLYIIEIDNDSSILKVNDKFLQDFGYSKEEIVGKDLYNFIPKADEEWFKAAIQEVFTTKQTKFLDVRFYNSDKLIVWTACFIFPDTENTDKIVILFTKDYKKEQLLKEEQRTNAIASILFTAELDKSGNFISMSEQFLHKINFTDEEIKKSNIFNFITDYEKEQYEQIWSNILKGRRHRSIRQFLDRNKNVIYFDMLFIPIIDANNNIEKIVLLAIDITDVHLMKRDYELVKESLKKTEQEFEKLTEDFEERLNTEKKLLTQKYEKQIEELELLSAFMENSNQAYIMSKDNVIVIYNSKAERIFGYKKDVVLGKKLRYLTPEIPELKENPKYLLNLLDKDIDFEKIIIVDRQQQAKEVLASLHQFQVNNISYTIIEIIA